MKNYGNKYSLKRQLLESTIDPTHLEKIMKLLKHEDESFVAQGIMLGLSIGMDEQKIFDAVYVNSKTWDGWRVGGKNWTLLEYMPDHPFWKTVELIRIDGDPEMTSIPQALELLPNLKRLIIEVCPLEGTVDQIANLKSLEVLQFINCWKTEWTLPESIGNLTNLKWLVISSCGQTSLPDSIANLKNLTHLIAPMNELITLPAGLGNLTNLQRLDVKQNKIQELPSDFMDIFNSSALREAVLEQNRLPLIGQPFDKYNNYERK